jgi:hypothetical protein
MNEEEIRAIVQQVLAAKGLPSSPAGRPVPHASHVRLSMVVPTPPGSPCVIEPSVNCNNCGYCLSMGH